MLSTTAPELLLCEKLFNIVYIWKLLFYRAVCW